MKQVNRNWLIGSVAAYVAWMVLSSSYEFAVWGTWL